MEAAELGIFMVSACTFGVLLEYPGSPVHQALPDPLLRRVLGGMAMGLTAVSIIYSPWGKRSGAHFNPSVTLTFWRLGKVNGSDAFFYVISQFIGAVIGVMLSAVVLQSTLMHPSVNYVATLPGNNGIAIAFIAEVIIAFIQMTMVLNVSNRMNIARYTGLFAGALVAIYISVEAPLSGMSLNPARTFGSAYSARIWNSLWIYFTAPPLGMLLAAESYLRLKGARGVLCAKLHHHNHKRCIFKCNFGECSQTVSPAAIGGMSSMPS
ncbi:MAG: MIP/aquaporin family protein [Blastocatellia bacterium]